jgi:spermidine synthase
VPEAAKLKADSHVQACRSNPNAIRGRNNDPVIRERVETPRGELVLRQIGEHFEIVSNGVFLMDTRDGRSERLLARAALDAQEAPRRVLVGGLGVGFTLATVLADDRVRSVTVVEVEPAVVAWQRSALARFSGRALDDGRVRVVVDDLVSHLRSTDASWDVICLDVDNGPDWTVGDSNSRLYDAAGTASLGARLSAAGVLAVWSSRPVPAYERVLRAQFQRVAVHRVPVERGEPDVVYVARRRPAPIGRPPQV